MYSHSSKQLSLSPNQFPRHQRDLSPTNKHQSRGSKYYSSQQVSRMIKSFIEPKLLYLRNQLEQKQRIIQSLNQKLDENDSKINRLSSYIENLIKRQKQSQHSQLGPVINQLLNDKLKKCWQVLNQKVLDIKEVVAGSIINDSKRMQQRIQTELQNIRNQSSEYIETSRVKNNSYWLKIKQALNRINSRVSKIDESLNNTIQSIEKSKQQHQMIDTAQFQRTKTTVKKLVELRKSVNNIYENYQNVLDLQTKFRQRIGELGGQSSNRHKKVNHVDNGFVHQFSSQSINQGQNLQPGANTFPMFRKKALPFQIQKNNFHKQFSNTQDLFYERGNKANSKQHDTSKQFWDDNFVLEYSKQQNGSEVFHYPYTSISKETDKNTRQTKNVQSNSNKKGISGPTQLEVSPIKTTPQSMKWQNGMTSPNQLSCLNSSVAALRNAASRSTSFVNLSLENRNQMSQSIKQRLQQIIELKNLTKPLMVFLDEINYLKNSEGNYLFDTRGNMFKVNADDGKELQRLGIIRFIQKTNMKQSFTQNKNSRVMSAAFGGQNSNSNSRSKSITPSGQKIKSISIKKINF